ncbi:hypothetical protein ACOZ4L_08035 [Haloplanus ruber]|uniref:Uncharacterized protein n=1 Tax=Haloplanus ruber TaxID=869892 RepID=A0ABD6CU15_9EURY|nr:hypothetical protein [Haloplanus ruber]
MTGSQLFEVFLTDEASDDFGDGSIRAESIQFYDSGVWVDHADGREFFPYRRVLRISERPTSATDDTSGERRDAAGGSAGTVDGAGLDVE